MQKLLDPKSRAVTGDHHNLWQNRLSFMDANCGGQWFSGGQNSKADGQKLAGLPPMTSLIVTA